MKIKPLSFMLNIKIIAALGFLMYTHACWKEKKVVKLEQIVCT